MTALRDQVPALEVEELVAKVPTSGHTVGLGRVPLAFRQLTNIVQRGTIQGPEGHQGCRTTNDVHRIRGGGRIETADIVLCGAGGVRCVGAVLLYNRAAGANRPAGRSRPRRAAGGTAPRAVAGRHGTRASAGDVCNLPWPQPDSELVGLHQGRVAGPHRHHGEAASARARNHLVVLATNYPIKDVPGAVLISGPATVTIKEWIAPTLGSRPHDSHAAADGSIWWTGQFASKLGRLDPRTGRMREFDVPANSQPHGLAEDLQGNIWYTGIQKNVIGRLDPRTGAVREYPVNAPGVRGPHTPILDKRSGNLFFTLQSGHVGRINLASGEMVYQKTPSDNTYPYGIRLNSQGVPWYVDFRGNRIGSVDPRTMEIKEVPAAEPGCAPTAADHHPG